MENEQVEMNPRVTEQKNPVSITEFLVVVMTTGYFLGIGAMLAFNTVDSLKSCIEKLMS